MNEMNAGDARPKTPVHLWIIGVLALLWDGVGAFDYLATKLKLEFWMGQYTDDQLAYFYGFPAWFTAFWAIAVWGALLGAVGLLLRKKWSVGAFGVAIVGLLVSTIYQFGMSNGAEIMGSFGVIFTAVIWVVSILLLVYARAMSKKGVLS